MFPRYSINDFLNCQDDERLEFWAQPFEEMPEPEDIRFPHQHDFYEILWITAGTSFNTIDFNRYNIKPDTLFFISPGQLHQFEDWNEVRGHCVMFTADFFLLNLQNKNTLFELSFLDNLYAQPLLELLPAQTEKLVRTIDLLYSETLEKLVSADAVRALLEVFLLQIQRIAHATSEKSVLPKSKITLFKNLQKLLDERFVENLSVVDYAALLNVTPHHLNRTIKEVTGNTAGEVIRARTILEAKRLLRFSSLNVGEIAERLGFIDVSYFTKFFKKCAQISPLEFRRAEMSENHQNL